jgi:hypothetical protein
MTALQARLIAARAVRAAQEQAEFAQRLRDGPHIPLQRVPDDDPVPLRVVPQTTADELR